MKIFKKKYPIEAVIKDSGKTFTVIMIDFDNQQVWEQQGQASGNGCWYAFDEVDLKWVENQ